MIVSRISPVLGDSPDSSGRATPLGAEELDDAEAARELPEWSPLGIAWPLWGAMASTLCMIVGWNWDISWHRCIGRDTTWTPAHVAIYIALALALAYNAALVWSFSFGRRRRVIALQVLGLRAPSGAFVTLWGVLLQFTAIVFDSWWHNVFGLDIAVFSPPHVLLGWGISCFYVGQIMIAIRHINSRPADRRARGVAILLGGIFIGHVLIALDPDFGPLGVRTRLFVATMPLTLVPLLVVVHTYARRPWAITASAAMYMLVIFILVQVFQLFPAAPRFAPVFHHVDRFFPPPFPVLLVVPAALLDWLLERTDGAPAWRVSLAASAVFVISFNGVNWLFAGFLDSPWAASRLFGGGYPANAFEKVVRTSPLLAADLPSVAAVVFALVLATVMSRAGIGIGNWLRRVVR